MEVFSISEADAAQNRAASTNNIQFNPVGLQESDGFTTWDSLKAGYVRDSAEAALVRTILDATGAERTRPDFNAYSYIQSDWDKEKQDRYAPYIADGSFDNLFSPGAVENQVSKIERDMELERKMAANPWTAFTGSMGANIFTLTNFIPGVNVASKERLLGSVANFAAHGLVSQGANEMLVRMDHPLRSWTESTLNIGTAGVIGGGIGAFAHALRPSNLLHPSHGKLTPQALGEEPVQVRIPGEDGVDVIGGDASVGAASASDIRAHFLSEAPEVIGAPVTKAITAVTPLGRLMHSPSSWARNVVTRLADTGGILTRAAKNRVSAGLSAEDLKAALSFERQQKVFTYGSEQHPLLNMELGKIGAPKIAMEELHDITEKVILKIDSEADHAALISKFGEKGAEMVRTLGQKWAKQFHETNAKYEADMVSLGVLRDQKAVDLFQGRITTADEQIKALNEKKTQVKVKAKEQREALPRGPEGKTQRDTIRAKQTDEVNALIEQIKALRAERETHSTFLRGEMEKAAPLGEDYGLMQAYDRATIMNDLAEFRQWLIEEVLGSRPDDEWLMMSHGLNQEQFARLAVEDPKRYREIMSTWTGDEHEWKIANLERAIDSAEEGARTADADLASLALRHKWADGKLPANRASLIRAKTAQVRAGFVARRTAKKKLVTERRALVKAAAAARQKTLDRAMEPSVERPDVGEQNLANLMATGRRKAALERKQGDIVGDVSQEEWAEFGGSLSEELGNLGKRIDAADARIDKLADADHTAKAPRDPAMTIDRAKAEARMSEINRELAEIDRLDRIDSAKLADANDKLAKYENRVARLNDLKKTMKDEMGLIAKERGINASDAKALRRELKKTLKRGAIDKVAEDISDHIVAGKNLPTDMTEHLDIETGRFKNRRLHFTPEQKKYARDKGWLDTSIPRVGKLQYEQMAGHVALRQAFDIRPGGMFEGWSGVVKSIEKDYESMILEATSAKVKGRLQKKMARDIKDVSAMRDRLLGMENVGLAKDSALLWTTRKFRQAGLIRFGSDFLVSSLTDVAVFSMNHRLIPSLIKYGPKAFRAATHGIPKDEVSTYARMFELSHGHMSLAARVGDADIMATGGIGAHGSLTRKVTAGIDLAGEKLSDTVVRWSGVPFWNTFWKSLAGYAQTHKLANLANKGWDQLTDAERLGMQTLNLDAQRLFRIKQYLEKHQEIDGGVIIPNTEKWSEGGADGVDAMRDFLNAIQRDQKRSIITLGIGDTPVLMDNWAAKSVLQFQSFSFAAANRYITPLLQGFAMDGKRLNSAMSFAMLMTMTLPIIFLKEMKKGNDPTEIFNDPERLGREMFDRSGLAAYASPYINLAAQTFNLAPSSRFQDRNAVTSLLGPSVGLLGDVNDLRVALKDGDFEQAAHKATTLAPFGPWFQRGWHLFSDD
jgi:hypothetical protein